MKLYDDGTTLHRAVLETPGEVTPRLVLADWLDDHDQGPRAEFIRLQCGLASADRKCIDCGGYGWTENQYGGKVDCKPCDGSGSRAVQLFKAHAREWFGAAVGGMELSRVGNSWSFTLCYRNRKFGVEAEAAVRRGFITCVRSEQPTLFGGIECPYCRDKAPDWETNAVECRNCDGTGLAWPPIAQELFEQHPIVSVELDDLEPLEEPRGSSRPQYRFEIRTIEQPWPDDVRELFNNGGLPGTLSDTKQPFPTLGSARWAMMLRCVQVGRKLAGLATLPEDTFPWTGWDVYSEGGSVWASL